MEHRDEGGFVGRSRTPSPSVAAVDVVVLADTHLKAGIKSLHPRLHRAMVRADTIIHAGDLVSLEALDGLRRLGTVHAVLGNNDHGLVGRLPESLMVELAGVRLAVVHDTGNRVGRVARIGRRFPDAQVVVFGHSHIPCDEEGSRGQLLFNPGSPTQRRSHPHRTFGRLRLAGGRVLGHRIEPLLDDRPG